MEKERYCEDLLALLKIMGAGESTIKGLLQFELFKTREAMKSLTKASVRFIYFGFKNSEYFLLLVIMRQQYLIRIIRISQQI